MNSDYAKFTVFFKLFRVCSIFRLADDLSDLSSPSECDSDVGAMTDSDTSTISNDSRKKRPKSGRTVSESAQTDPEPETTNPDPTGAAPTSSHEAQIIMDASILPLNEEYRLSVGECLDPKFTSSPDDVTVSRGNHVTLTCQVAGTDPIGG